MIQTCTRAVLSIIIILTCNSIVDFGTNEALLIIAALLGCFIGHRLSQSKINKKGISTFILLALFFLIFISSTASALFSSFSSNFFTPHTLSLHFNIFILIAGSTALYCALIPKMKSGTTFELIALATLIITLLAPHRNLNFDSPRAIADLAWALGISTHALLIIAACICALVLSLYLPLGATLHRDNHQVEDLIEPNQGNRWQRIGFSFLFLLFLIGTVGQLVYSSFDTSQGLLSNGVGQGNQEGSSPLGFHSALGGSNQPAALVRLETDYQDNPTLPLLFMREGALSMLRGNELVIAPSHFDTDVSNTTPTQRYSGLEQSELGKRKKVNYSVYLLSDQKAAFGIDYPIAIIPIKNPDSSKFRSAYKASSLAPIVPLADLTDARIGNSDWSKETWDHYLQTHQDTRYGLEALEITQDVASPVSKALAIIRYLSTTTTYTLKPDHELEPNADPVAPYLFGDKRGYCVHFAHAITYMLRSLGIPARIATGYLTDLSQAKDGHILLRMSDRHAWSEMYVTRHGWIPIDIEPANVESHADTPVDASLLEDLMGVLEPGEELLPEELSEGEEDVNSPIKIPVSPRTPIWLLLGATLALIATKLGFRYSWKLAATSEKRLNAAYLAVESYLIDIGITRKSAETRKEYLQRASLSTQGKLPLLEKLLTKAKFTHSPDSVSKDQIGEAITITSDQKWYKKILTFLNPRSITTILGKKK